MDGETPSICDALKTKIEDEVLCSSSSVCYNFYFFHLNLMTLGVKGVIDFGMGLTLREGDREYYYEALDKHFPGMKERYIKQYGNAYELPSPNSKELRALFQDICEKNGILSTPDECFRYMSDLPDKYTQISLFDF